MFKRVTRGWIARAGIATAVIAAAIFGAVTFMGSASTHAASPPNMQWTASGGGAQTVGGTFTVNLNATNPSGFTWGGYSMELGYNPGVLKVVSVAAGGLAGCSGPNWANPSGPANSPIIATGCAFQSTTAASPPPTETIQFQCIGVGNSPLHFVTLVEDPISGSSFFDPNAVNLATDLVNGSVDCGLPITKTVVGAGPFVAGGTVQYKIHVGNPGATSVPGQVVGDALPAGETATAISSPTDPGAVCSLSPLGCVGTAQPDPIGLDVLITANISPTASGVLLNCAQLNPPNGASSCAPITVGGASLSVTKVSNAASQQAGGAISWTITVSSNGPAAATGVVVTDTPGAGWTAAGATTFNVGTMAANTTQTFTVSGTVNDPVPGDATCRNSVSVASTNVTPSVSASATTACLSKNVKMEKHTVGEIPSTHGGTIPQVNLWLCKAATCTANGQGSLTVGEFVSNVSGDQQGVGAFEFQLKYDNHLFDVLICEGSAPLQADGTCAPIVVGSPLHWLYATGRVPGAPGIGGCAATIITENDIRFGCVSKNPVDGNGNPIITQGNTADGQVATITVTPKADLVNRITPGNNNGTIATLLNEGCELADIWGHPLEQTIGTFPNLTTKVDALGRPILLPGIAPGGQVIDCADITITIRILEGDMNLDCAVTVADDQIEASHYGAFFGNLLYQPWFDLEPALKDGDVDIKDLQKVFGRNGSTCAAPVPAQPPLPMPVDP